MIGRMKKWAGAALAVSAFAGVSLSAKSALACGANQTEVYRSAKSAWCVQNSIISQHGAFPTKFFAYGDDVVDTLVALFDVPAEGLYTYEASVANGSAHTGSECCNLGVTVSGDAFYNDAYGAKGFWGYLLALHEMINDFTGQVSSGWPTDFWADHISAFPNSMDWRIMETLGNKNNDATLKKSAVSQKKRFYPGGDSEDRRVPMFDKIFDLPNFGYPGLSRVFSLVNGDQMSWDGLGVANPDVKRTEYVMAFMSLGVGKPVTPIMRAAHVGDGTASGAGDPGYVVSDANIDAIAKAHCSVKSAGAQGKNVAAAKTALRSGRYAQVTVTGTCGAGCTDECGCKSTTNTCVPLWLSDAPDNPPGPDASVPADAGGPKDAGTVEPPPVGSGDSGIGPGPGPDNPDNGADNGSNPDTASGCGTAPASRAPVAPFAALLAFVGLTAILRRRRG